MAADDGEFGLGSFEVLRARAGGVSCPERRAGCHLGGSAADDAA
jgi:hypothetical protein